MCLYPSSGRIDTCYSLFHAARYKPSICMQFTTGKNEVKVCVPYNDENLMKRCYDGALPAGVS